MMKSIVIKRLNDLQGRRKERAKIKRCRKKKIYQSLSHLGDWFVWEAQPILMYAFLQGRGKEKSSVAEQSNMEGNIIQIGRKGFFKITSCDE